MKLYATTTSERATKGQGGNSFLRIELTVGDSENPQNIGSVELINFGDDNYKLTYWEYSNKKIPVILKEGKIKGKNQKGENAYYYDLSTSELKKYYNSLNINNVSEEHIAEVEKELENRH